MEGKLLNVCVILCGCWDWPSSASLPQLASPINPATPLYSSWLQQYSLSTSPRLPHSSLTTSPGLHQSPLTTSPGLQQSPLTTRPGPARSPKQHPPLVSTRDVPLTGNTPIGETQSSGQNPLQPIVSHLYPNTTLLRRKKRMDCFSEGVRVSNNLKEVMKTDRQSGTLYFYPEDDFEFVRIILTVTHGEQDGVFNKGDLCVKETQRWYTLAFSTYEALPGAIKWGIMVKVDNCINHSPTSYLYYLNWFYHMRVEAKGSSYWSTRAPGSDCLNPLPDHTTAGGQPGAPVATLPSAADDTTAGGESGAPVAPLPSAADDTTAGGESGAPVSTLTSAADDTTAGGESGAPVATLPSAADDTQTLVDHTILPVVVLTIVSTVDLVIVVIWCRSRKGRTGRLGIPPASRTHPPEASDNPMYDEVRI
ncbi:uncharacterized protein [Procambarus clarkii]|uniref:uncharacterized protein isoform X1 n=1 Tax=Procambarus clarkii TaxID=6728 RepID=UPI00374229A5